MSIPCRGNIDPVHQAPHSTFYWRKDTQEAFINVDGGTTWKRLSIGAGVQKLVSYTESEGVSSTSSGSYQNKINTAFVTLAKDYIVMAMYEDTTQNAGKFVDTKLMVDGVEQGQTTRKNEVADQYFGHTLVSRKVTLTAGSKDFKIQFRTNPLTPAETVRIRRARLYIYEVQS